MLRPPFSFSVGLLPEVFFSPDLVQKHFSSKTFKETFSPREKPQLTRMSCPSASTRPASSGCPSPWPSRLSSSVAQVVEEMLRAASHAGTAASACSSGSAPPAAVAG